QTGYTTHLLYFFFTTTPPHEIYTLSLHDALPIFQLVEKDSPAQAHLRQRKRLEFRVHRIAHRSACRVSKHAPERRETAARNDRGRPGCGCRGGNPLAAIPTMLPAHHGLPETLSQHPGASALCQCTSQSR